jgi:hypothetical protein
MSQTFVSEFVISLFLFGVDGNYSTSTGVWRPLKHQTTFRGGNLPSRTRFERDAVLHKSGLFHTYPGTLLQIQPLESAQGSAYQNAPITRGSHTAEMLDWHQGTAAEA